MENDEINTFTHLVQSFFTNQTLNTDTLSQQITKSPDLAKIYSTHFLKQHQHSPPAIALFVASITQIPQNFDLLSKFSLTPQQKITAAANFSTHFQQFPALDEFLAFRTAEIAEITILIANLLKKPESEFAGHKSTFLALLHQFYMCSENSTVQDFGNVIKAISQRTKYQKNLPPLSYQFLTQITPVNFEHFTSFSLQTAICNLITSIFPSAFNVTNIIINLSKHNNSRFAALYSKFICDNRIFEFLNQTEGNILFLAKKVAQNESKIVEKISQSNFWLKNCQCEEFLPEELEGKIIANFEGEQLKSQAFCLLFTAFLKYLVRNQVDFVLPGMSQIERFYAGQNLQEVKKLYIQLNQLDVNFFNQNFENCFLSVFNVQGREEVDKMSVKQMIYYCFVGRKYNYFLSKVDSYIPRQILLDAEKLSQNVLKGLFLLQCNEVEKQSFLDENFVIPGMDKWQNEILRVFRGFELAKQNQLEEFNVIYNDIKKSYPETLVGQICQKHQFTHKFHVLQERQILVNDNILQQMLKSYISLPAISKQCKILIDLINQTHLELSITSFLPPSFSSLIHPKMRSKFDQQLIEVFQNIENNNIDECLKIVFPFQISEFIGESEEKYILANGILALLILFTGEFHNNNQYVLMKYVCKIDCKQIYQLAFQQIDYDETLFYGKYFTQNQVINNMQKCLKFVDNNLVQFLDFNVLPCFCGISLLQLIKSQNSSSIFNFNNQLDLDLTQSYCYVEERKLIKLLGKFNNQDIIQFCTQINFSLPSIQLQRMFFNTKNIIFNNMLLVNCKYEFPKIFDIIKDKIFINQETRRLIDIPSNRMNFIILGKLLDLPQNSVKTALKKVQTDMDIENMGLYPFKKMQNLQVYKNFDKVLQFQWEICQEINGDFKGLKWVVQ